MMLEARGISKSIDYQEVLRNVDFTIQPGQVAGLVGRNGAGKTTLFKTIAGVLTPDSGTVTFEGHSVHHHAKIRENIVFVPDSPEALLGYTPSDAALLFAGVYPAFDRAHFVETMGKLEIPLYRKVRQLSKGMRMIFSIALGLATRARLVLLDEPTNGIDPIAKKQVLTLMIAAVQEGATLLVSSHLLEELERIADTVLIMKNGAIETHVMDDRASGPVRKLQVVFQGEAPADLLALSGICVLEQIGRVYTVIVDTEHKDGAWGKLHERNPLLLEPLPMKLEDLFFWKLGGRTNGD